ncbi:LIM/homeobox protein Lhx5 [Biomphalaria glabrata]|nr:LIM/homeobox protein Lhx5 [Biomphalaria glabrata]
MTGPEQTNNGCPSGQLPLSSAVSSTTQYMDSNLVADIAEGPPLCVRCSLPIFDQFILQLQGQTWHSNCLRCSVCQGTLSQMCYSDNSQLYCQNDFFKIFGASCSRCQGIITPTEIVRRAHGYIYHLGCFRCSVCNGELRTGDEFYVSDGALLFCKADYLATKQKQNEALHDDIQMQALKEVLENQADGFYLDDADLGEDLLGKIAENSSGESSTIHVQSNQRTKNGKRIDNPASSQQKSDFNASSRVHPPTNGYPLPIVNPVSLSGQSTGHPQQNHQLSSTINKHTFDQSYLKSLEELWSNDFVPPNVNLEPQHILNGNVIAEYLLSGQQQQQSGQSSLCAILSES